MKKKRTKKRLKDELIFRKVLIPWKLFFFLPVFFLLSVQVYSQTVKVSVNFTETPLAEIFTALGKQAGVVFLYDQKLIGSKGKVNLKAEDKALEKVLKEFLPPLGLTYVFEDGVVIIREVQGQQTVKATRIITGVVTDEDDQPLPGVHVVLKGSLSGVATITTESFGWRLKAV